MRVRVPALRVAQPAGFSISVTPADGRPVRLAASAKRVAAAVVVGMCDVGTVPVSSCALSAATLPVAGSEYGVLLSLPIAKSETVSLAPAVNCIE